MSAYRGQRKKRLPKNYSLQGWMDDHLIMSSRFAPKKDPNAGYQALERVDTADSIGIRMGTLNLLNRLDLLPDSGAADGYQAGLEDVKRALFPDGQPPTQGFRNKLAQGDVPWDFDLFREDLGFHSSSMSRIVALYDTRGAEYSRSYVPFNVAEDAELGEPITIIQDHRSGHWYSVNPKPGERLPQPCLLCWKECAPTIAASAAHRRIHQHFTFWECNNLSQGERRLGCGCIEDASNPPSLLARQIDSITL